MTTRQYDERQLATRNRISTVAFFVLMILVFVNGFLVDEVGPWGTGLDQALTLGFLASTVFSVGVIMTGAYFGRTQDWRATAAVFAVLVVAYLGLFGVDLLRGEFRVWQDGHAGPRWQPTVMLLFFAANLTAILVRRALDARAEDE